MSAQNDDGARTQAVDLDLCDTAWDGYQRLLCDSAGWRMLLVSGVLGMASSLAFAPTHLAPLLFITLPSLLILIRGEPIGHRLVLGPSSAAVPHDAKRIANTWSHRAWRGALAGWGFAFGYHLVGLHWIGNAFLVQAEIFAWALPFAVTLMPAGLALFFAVAGAFVAIVPKTWCAPWATFVVAIVAVEWARSVMFTGFPWNVLGYALAWPIQLMQLAAFVGLYGMTVLVLVLALAPALVWSRKPLQRRAAYAIASAVVPIGLLLGFGAVRLSTPPPPDVADVRLRLVQPSIDQRRKWQAAFQRSIFEEHLALSRRAPDGTVDNMAGITHLLWAEAAMPFRPLDSGPALNALAQLVPSGTQLIAGILRVETRNRQLSTGVQRERDVFNSAVVFDADARPLAIYDKIHLVPFGEYLPFPAFLKAIGFETLVQERGGLTAATWPRPTVSVPGLPPVEFLICYEVIFPHEVARGADRPGVLVNLTNDGWFGTLSGPYQHFQQSRMRAVEFGLPVIRVSNNGISAIIDGFGRIKAYIPLNAVATADANLPGAPQSTVYAHWRDWSVGLLLAFVAAFGIRRRYVRPE